MPTIEWNEYTLNKEVMTQDLFWDLKSSLGEKTSFSLRSKLPFRDRLRAAIKAESSRVLGFILTLVLLLVFLMIIGFVSLVSDFMGFVLPSWTEAFVIVPGLLGIGLLLDFFGLIRSIDSHFVMTANSNIYKNRLFELVAASTDWEDYMLLDPIALDNFLFNAPDKQLISSLDKLKEKVEPPLFRKIIAKIPVRLKKIPESGRFLNS